jgi:MerR HTH family regulatory protein
VPDAELWTIDQLCALAAAELLASEQSQPSARVREVPDRRTIRWYATIGLLDRPAEMRGRTALYGRRHLLQIVAIKRLQATGIPLAEVQERLAGATSSTLEGIAELSAAPARGSMRLRARGPVRQAVPLAGGGPQAGGVPQPETNTGPAGRRGRFWAAVELAAAAGQASAAVGSAPAAGHYDSALVPAIRLGGGVTLTLSRASRIPDSDEIAAIRQAAGPLLDLLHARGLDAHNIREDR